jgi:hypothetical protein
LGLGNTSEAIFGSQMTDVGVDVGSTYDVGGSRATLSTDARTKAMVSAAKSARKRADDQEHAKMMKKANAAIEFIRKRIEGKDDDEEDGDDDEEDDKKDNTDEDARKKLEKQADIDNDDTRKQEVVLAANSIIPASSTQPNWFEQQISNVRAKLAARKKRKAAENKVLPWWAYWVAWVFNFVVIGTFTYFTWIIVLNPTFPDIDSWLIGSTLSMLNELIFYWPVELASKMFLIPAFLTIVFE